MPLSYILGNLIGRAIVSFVLVWIVCLLASRLNWRQALNRSGRWYSLLAVAGLTVLGMGSAMLHTGAVQ